MDIATMQLMADLETQCAHYAFSWDDRNMQGWLDVFTEDGIFALYDIGALEPSVYVQGQEELAAFAQQKFAELGTTRTHHRQCSLLLHSATETDVSSRIKVLVTHQTPDESTPDIAFSGVYYDTWRLVDGVWKLARRVFRP